MLGPCRQHGRAFPRGPGNVRGLQGDTSTPIATAWGAGAARCEGVASAIGDLDRDLAARGAGAARARA